MGAALLRTPEKLAGILEALVEHVGKVWEIGISVKIRLLETPEKTEQLVRRLCKTGITGLTIHCRTTPMRPRERAVREQLRMIGQVCREHGVACLMNGDVKNRDEGTALAHEYGVDGGMIATAAESNSSAFRTKEQGGLAPWREVVTEYLKLAMSVENKWGNTKFLLSQLIPGKDPVYQPVTMSKTHVQCFKILALDQDMMARAQELDSVLGLNAQVSLAKKHKRPLEEGMEGKTSILGRGKRKQNVRETVEKDSESSHGGIEVFGQIAMAV